MIRDLKEEDLNQVYALGNLLNENFSKGNPLEKSLMDSYTHTLVYESDKKIKGFLMYIELEDTIDILNLYVDKKERNKKIASNLIDTMFSNMGQGIKMVTLEVRTDNVPAISLYKKFGFLVLHTRKNYYNDTDAYLMGRRIVE